MAELSVDDRGAGTPVLFLHSSGMSSRQWKALGDTLATSHRVVAPDFFGVGRNPPWPVDERFVFQTDVEAVAHILQGLPEPAHIVGHSYGGLVAVTLARTYPKLVRSVVAYEPVAFGVLYDPRDEEALTELDGNRRDPVWSDDARGGSEAWMEAFVDFWNGPGAFRALPEPARAGFVRVGRKVYYEVSSLLGDRTPSEAYRVCDAPALLLYGERSPLPARRVAVRLASAFPHGSSHMFAGAGHMGPVTHAGAVNALIARHIEEAERAGNA